MEEVDLKRAGQNFRVGDDLYGVSIKQLRERVEILNLEQERVLRAIGKKTDELSSAEDFFKKN